MDPNLFNVIYTGKLLDGFDEDEVIKAFSAKFKLPEAKASKIIQSQKEMVLKPRAEHVKAYKFKSALEAIGMEVKLERAALVAPKPKAVEEKQASHSKTDSKQTASQKPTPKKVNPQALGNASWSLEPMAKEQPEEENDEPPKQESHSYQSQPLSQPSEKPEVSRPVKKSVSVESGRTVGELIKTIGGFVVAGAGVLFIAVKKFGLFKILKIGGLMTATAFAGYEAEEICMGNGLCEEAIEDQIDSCWDLSGMDDHDWENMTDEEYFTLKPKLENEFVSCFVYDSGERVLESPLEVRFDLIDNCYMTENADCLQLAESQLKSCYEVNNIEYLVPANTMDYYQAIFDNPNEFKNYYSCFVDANGAPLFASILDQWEDVYYGDY